MLNWSIDANLTKANRTIFVVQQAPALWSSYYLDKNGCIAHFYLWYCSADKSIAQLEALILDTLQ